MKILYDISAILKGIGEEKDRTGIYFCAYNVLKEMALRDDVELGFYNSAPQWCYYEKKLKDMLSISDVNLVYSSKLLSGISKLWITIYERKRLCKNGKRNLEFLYRLLGLGVRKTACLCAAIGEKCRVYKDFDFFFSPMLQAPDIILKNSRIKSVIVLHDTIPFMYPEYYPEMNGLRKYWIKRLVETMNDEELFLANSQNTKRDFLTYKKGLMSQRIRVVYHACSEQFVPCNDKAKILFIKQKYHIPLDKKYVFSLCTIEPRKNLVRIVKTFIEFIKKNQIEDLVLVLGGGHWENFIKEFNDSVSKIDGFTNIVCRVGYVAEEDLPYLYSGALFFVYTSQYEGFGVPVLEAMKCGCPVIASNNSSIPEVVGEAGILIEWDSDEQHIQAYEKYFYNENYRLRQVQKSLRQAELFSWRIAVDNMLAEMERDKNV